MSLFKLCLQHDIDDVFLNLDEFAEVIELDGRQITAVVDRGGADYPDVSDDRQGLAMESVTIITRRDNLERGKYHPGLACVFNGEQWHVLACTGEDLARLSLYKERS